MKKGDAVTRIALWFAVGATYFKRTGMNKR